MIATPSLLDPKLASPKIEKRELALLLSRAADLLGRYGARTSGGKMEAEAKELAEKIEDAANFLIDDDGSMVMIPTDTALLIEGARFSAKEREQDAERRAIGEGHRWRVQGIKSYAQRTATR